MLLSRPYIHSRISFSAVQLSDCATAACCVETGLFSGYIEISPISPVWVDYLLLYQIFLWQVFNSTNFCVYRPRPWDNHTQEIIFHCNFGLLSKRSFKMNCLCCLYKSIDFVKNTRLYKMILVDTVLFDISMVYDAQIRTLFSLQHIHAGIHVIIYWLLKGIKRAGEEQEQKVSMEFLIYGTRTSKDKSGAYLFLPDGDAKV